MSAKIVELYYDFSSTNSYFAALLTPESCQHIGAALRWDTPLPDVLGQRPARFYRGVVT